MNNTDKNANKMRIIDLRSDTVTLPTPEMKKLMIRAPLGDDVFKEDPTLNLLQEMAAKRLGKEDALFVASGTMANLASLLTHCSPGDEVILGDRAHVFLNEAAGMAVVGGIQPHTIPNQPDGTLLLDDINKAVRRMNEHFPKTRLICLENTHNYCNGMPLTKDYMDSVGKFAHDRGLGIHLDGARIFNAAVALDEDVKDLTRHADSVSFCLSKGLSAPVGSLICGTKKFVAEARRKRKLLGGGMRQAGVLAAAGIVSLEKMIERLKEDHDHARRFAEGIAQIPDFNIDLTTIKTNIIFFSLINNKIRTQKFLLYLGQRGIKMLSLGPNHLRAVTHYGITKKDIDTALSVINDAVKKLS